jgi:PAS domain S-box-containing protein
MPGRPDFAEAVLEALPGLVFVFDDDNELAWWNESLQEVTGYSAQTLRGMALPTLFADADVQALQRTLEAVRADTKSATVDAALVTELGDTISCEVTGRPFPDGTQRAGWVVGVGRDASAHDTKDQELRRERNRLATLYGGLPSPVVHYRVQDGKAIVQGVNVAFEEVFGVSEEALTGQDLDVLIAPDEQAGQAEILTQRAVEEGSVQAEVVRETEDESRHFRLNSVLLSRGEQPEGYAIYTDVTEQKEREQTLRDEQKALRSMYRITADQEASFEEKIQRLIDLGREYLSLPYGFLTHISDDAQQIVHAAGTHPLLQPGSSCPLPESYCRKTIQKGSLLAVQDAVADGWEDDPAYDTFGLGTYIGSQILVEDELYGTFCFAASEARDESFSERERTFVELMTRWASYELEHRRATERLERQNERLDSFASLVTHDLRNPLNVAKGRLELARDTGDLSHLAAVSRGLDRMDAIIEDVLTLTWGGQDLDPDALEACDLARLTDECWEHVDMSEATLQTDDGEIVKADEGRLQRLLENLFRNAVEHGGNDVTIWVGRLDNGFFVEDDGPGIPEETREKVFEAGYSSEEEGTGLGLSIVGTIAEAHGWTVSVTEGREGGARFELTGVDIAGD